jgi:hypothetical protein
METPMGYKSSQNLKKRYLSFKKERIFSATEHIFSTVPGNAKFIDDFIYGTIKQGIK